MTPTSSPTRLAVLVNGSIGSIEWIRATQHLGFTSNDSTLLLVRRGGSLSTWISWIQECQRFRPELLYVINTASPGVPFALWRKLVGNIPFVLDTGDLVFEMARRSGIEPAAKWPILWAGEQAGWHACETLVVRSECFRQHLHELGFHHAMTLPDGFAPPPELTDRFAIQSLRRKLGLGGFLVAGVMGSLIHSPKLNLCYGWDLISALPMLTDLPFRALIVGDGPGRPWLEKLALRLSVQDRVVFAGRVPYAELHHYLQLMDVAISTQTNNLPGRVRTTGKLPEYMAAGRFILASKLGEAARVLPEPMLIDYEGDVDLNYPKRLAERLRGVAGDPEKARVMGTSNRALAEKHFGKETLQSALRGILARNAKR